MHVWYLCVCVAGPHTHTTTPKTQWEHRFQPRAVPQRLWFLFLVTIIQRELVWFLTSALNVYSTWSHLNLKTHNEDDGSESRIHHLVHHRNDSFDTNRKKEVLSVITLRKSALKGIADVYCSCTVCTFTMFYFSAAHLTLQVESNSSFVWVCVCICGFSVAILEGTVFWSTLGKRIFRGFRF